VVSTIVSAFIADDPQDAIERITASFPESNSNPVQGLIVIPPFQPSRFQLAMIDDVWTAACTTALGLDLYHGRHTFQKRSLCRTHECRAEVGRLMCCGPGYGELKRECASVARV
jgi:hypothetical protein